MITLTVDKKADNNFFISTSNFYFQSVRFIFLLFGFSKAHIVEMDFIFCLTILSFLFVASANDTSVCNGFRITSPVALDLVYTAGQCYQISFDVGNSVISEIESVELLEAKTDKQISMLWKGPIKSSGTISTPYFKMDLGSNPQTGIYKYRMTGRISGKNSEVCRFGSIWFKVIVDSLGNNSVIKCPE
ncbi:hypothetical protein G9A89_000918 [Geosiphon pyriformis]|nr:hypothetical protein G9A89_000918 [Geosiphon pyriformis]